MAAVAVAQAPSFLEFAVAFGEPILAETEREWELLNDWDKRNACAGAKNKTTKRPVLYLRTRMWERK